MIGFINFFADPPHLIKTSRNCLYHSGEGKSRHMWNSEGCLLRGHIRKLAYDDLNRGCKKIPKLSLDHVDLTSYSVMKVKLAAQVLSTSVANLLRKDYQDTKVTAEYCEKMNNFFDCLNV